MKSRADNPVEGPLPKREALQAVRIIEASVDSLAQSVDAGAQGYFGDRIATTKRALETIKTFSVDSDVEAFIYRFDGQPIGVLCLSDRDDCVEIECMATDPLSDGAGGALIEAAVRYSEQNGHRGVVRLRVPEAAASAAYVRYGFSHDADEVQTGEAKMTLRPARSADWVEREDGWTIVRHDGKTYATGFGTS